MLDGAPGPAMGTSHANGAQLSYCYTDALGSPATLSAMPRMLFRNDGVSFRMSLRPSYLLWLWAFLRNCSQSRFEANTLAVLDLALQSRAAMDALCTRHDLDFRHRVAGKIHLLYSPRDRARAEMVRTLKARAGCEQHLLAREELTQLDPALADIDQSVIGAISTPSEVVGDPFQFCTGLSKILTREYGVDARFGEMVEGITEGAGDARVALQSGEIAHADVVVVATGTGSNRLLAPLGLGERIEAMKGYSFEVPMTEQSPRVSVTDGKRRLVFTHLGDRLRIAGIAELGERSRTVDPARMEWMIRAARECLPHGGDYARADHFWTGLRPVTPSSQPLVKRATKRIAINTGHGALGWTLAMGSAERLASQLEQPS